MYAIAFDLDTEVLAALYHNPSYTNAYDDIRRVFEEFSFERQQGSVYFAQRDNITAVDCVLAVQDVSRRYPWFRNVVKDIRMLRIEENNDLMPALGDHQPLAPAGTAAE